MIWVCLNSFSRSYFRKSHCPTLDKPARKQYLTRNSHSRSLEVVHFGITEKPTTDCVLLYNNVDLISKVSAEMASENAENCRCRQPHCRSTHSPQGTPANIRINLLQKVETLGYIFADDSMGLSSFRFSWWAPKDQSFLQ